MRDQTTLPEQGRPHRTEVDNWIDRGTASAWRNGELSGSAPAFAAELVKLVPEAGDLARARSLLVLGVLHEAERGDPEVVAATRAAVSEGLAEYLSVAGGAAANEVTRLALVFLLAHFHEHQERIEPVIQELGATADDEARLRRCLLPPSSAGDSEYEVGRAWPTPEIWRLTETERAVDESWRAGLELSPADVAAIGGMETKAVLAYLGAQAEFAIWKATDAD